MSKLARSIAIVGSLLASVGCQFSPTAPFSGFDERGSRIVGQFDGGSGSAMSAQRLHPATSAATTGAQGIVVLIAERPSVTGTVDQAGSFTLSGFPSGSLTLVFQLDGRTIGEIRLMDVRRNQGVRIDVMLTGGGDVVLVREQRDQVSFADECPRGAGFWCQNRGGQNPNLSSDEFNDFTEEAAALLTDVAALDTADEVAAAVCNTGNQFQRQLASLTLNLAAETVDLDTPLRGEQTPYATVGDAFEAAVDHLSGAAPLTGAQAEALKDVMDRINNAQNIAGCDQLPEDDDAPPPPPSEMPSAGQMTICHIPPGNYFARQTITVDASAWPAHKGHCAQGTCDYVGSCR